MNCLFEDYSARDENGRRRVRCVRCGLVTAPTRSPMDRIYCSCCGNPRWFDFGWQTARVLSRLGVTKYRWNALRKWLGLIEPCKCGEREAWANSLGGRVVLAYRGVVQTVKALSPCGELGLT